MTGPSRGAGGPRTVERRMRALSLQGVPNERATTTTRPRPADTHPDDALNRNFVTTAPNSAWVPISRTFRPGLGSCMSPL